MKEFHNGIEWMHYDMYLQSSQDISAYLLKDYELIGQSTEIKISEKQSTLPYKALFYKKKAVTNEM